MQRNTDNSSYNCARVRVRTVSWSCSISYVSMSPRVTKWKLFFFWALAKMLESHSVRCGEQRQEDGRNGEREKGRGAAPAALGTGRHRLWHQDLHTRWPDWQAVLAAREDRSPSEKSLFILVVVEIRLDWWAQCWNDWYLLGRQSMDSSQSKWICDPLSCCFSFFF